MYKRLIELRDDGVLALIIIGVMVVGFVIMYSLPEKKKLIIVEDYNFKIEKVKDNDTRVTNVWHQGEVFIINNSSESIFLESVIYSTFGFGSGVSELITIDNNSIITPIENEIQYIFEEPSQKISTKKRDSEIIKWYLHR